MTLALLTVVALGFADVEPVPALPRSLMDFEPSVQEKKEDSLGWWLGARAGFLKAKDADDGTWVVGAQLRWHVAAIFAFEASVEVHRDEFNDGDVEVFTIPVQLSAMLFIPLGGFRPYVLAGVGWYFTETSFSGPLSNLDDDTDSVFGGHVGIGLELMLGRSFSINADFRYIFLDEPDSFRDDDFDYWEFTIGLNFKLGG
jgi:hypothetical protein